MVVVVTMLDHAMTCSAELLLLMATQEQWPGQLRRSDGVWGWE